MARVRSRPGRVIDFKSWSFAPAFSTVLAAVGTTIGGSVLFTGPATILRVRGAVQASFDSTVQNTDQMRLVFGLGIVSTDAATLGASAVPDPGGEAEYPWLWWGSMQLRASANAAEGAWGTQAQKLEVDSKAMRRVKPGESLLWVVEVASVTGAPVTNIDFLQTRVFIGV